MTTNPILATATDAGLLDELLHRALLLIGDHADRASDPNPWYIAAAHIGHAQRSIREAVQAVQR